ncbi:MAG: metalloenzyme [Thermodesulfobacteriota bacterium]
MNHIVFVIMDSCRHDTFVAAATPSVDAFAAANGTGVEKRYSYASWTSPAHYAYLMGMMPHTSPRGVFASEVYKEEFSKWVERIGQEGLSFRTFVPELSLPKVLKDLGYRTVARVSMPVLNPMTSMAVHFDDYRLMDSHNDFAGMIDGLDFGGPAPVFSFLNLGETHYPYMLQGEDLPHISGVHGVFKHMDDLLRDKGKGAGQPEEKRFFDPQEMERLRQQQVRCVEYLDGQYRRLFGKAPEGTHIIITSDHGELFGEDGYFGHGPVMHEKCFEVPFLEGKVTAGLKAQLAAPGGPPARKPGFLGGLFGRHS